MVRIKPLYTTSRFYFSWISYLTTNTSAPFTSYIICLRQILQIFPSSCLIFLLCGTFFSELFYRAFHLSTTSERPNKGDTEHEKKKKKKIKTIHRNFIILGNPDFISLIRKILAVYSIYTRRIHASYWTLRNRMRWIYFHSIRELTSAITFQFH